MGELFDRSFETDPSIGDRLTLGDVTLVARIVEDDRVSEVAVVLPRSNQS